MTVEEIIREVLAQRHAILSSGASPDRIELVLPRAYEKVLADWFERTLPAELTPLLGKLPVRMKLWGMRFSLADIETAIVREVGTVEPGRR